MAEVGEDWDEISQWWIEEVANDHVHTAAPEPLATKGLREGLPQLACVEHRPIAQDQGTVHAVHHGHAARESLLK